MVSVHCFATILDLETRVRLAVNGRRLFRHPALRVGQSPPAFAHEPVLFALLVVHLDLCVEFFDPRCLLLPLLGFLAGRISIFSCRKVENLLVGLPQGCALGNQIVNA